MLFADDRVTLVLLPIKTFTNKLSDFNFFKIDVKYFDWI